MRVRTEAQRQKILDAAWGVFLKAGFERASMSEISGALGGSKGTLYSYFSSKEELFVAVVGERMSTVGESMEALSRDDVADPRNALLQFAQEYLATTQTPEAVALKGIIQGFVHHNVTAGQAFWDTGVGHLIGVIGAFLSRAHDAKTLKIGNSLTAARQFLSLLEEVEYRGWMVVERETGDARTADLSAGVAFLKRLIG